jgi:esterase/lipase superfamily enzyme
VDAHALDREGSEAKPIHMTGLEYTIGLILAGATIGCSYWLVLRASHAITPETAKTNQSSQSPLPLMARPYVVVVAMLTLFAALLSLPAAYRWLHPTTGGAIHESPSLTPPKKSPPQPEPKPLNFESETIDTPIATSSSSPVGVSTGSNSMFVPVRNDESESAGVKTTKLYGKSRALVIGIDSYSDSAWPNLKNGVMDANLVGRALIKQGFDVTVRTNVIGSELRAALSSFLFTQDHEGDTRLVIWFSGHGHTFRSHDGVEEGFLIPSDAPPPSSEGQLKKSALSLREFNNILTNSPAKHVLAVLDSCVSDATFLRSVNLNNLHSPFPPSVARPIRRVITAGSANEATADDGLFGRIFTEALSGGGVGLGFFDDGYLTGAELGRLIERKLTEQTGGRQHPLQTSFSGGDSGGDIVFQVRSNTAGFFPMPTTRGMRPSAPITAPSDGSVSEIVRPPAMESSATNAGGTTPVTVPDDKPYASVPVLFGTDRKQGETRRAKWGDNVDTFGGESQFKLALGKAIVTVPIQKGVRQRGSVPRPELVVFGFRVPWGTEQLDKHFTVYSANTLDEASFLAEVKVTLAKSKSAEKHALLFVHGYNVTFEDSLYRTAQIAHDLEFDGAAFVYSWPSKGDPKAYLYDEDRARGARPHLRAYLEMITAKTDVKNLHVVAHSKGAELLVEVLNELSATPDIAKKLRIYEIILAAPDIDRANFEQIAARVVGIAQRGVTLYASNNDKALSLSNTIRLGTVRAGEVPANRGPVLVKGMDTIDISAASTDFFSSNQITFAERQAVIADMRSILDKGQHPPELRSLSLFKAISIDRGKYWQYVK